MSVKRNRPRRCPRASPQPAAGEMLNVDSAEKVPTSEGGVSWAGRARGPAGADATLPGPTTATGPIHRALNRAPPPKAAGRSIALNGAITAKTVRCARVASVPIKSTGRWWWASTIPPCRPGGKNKRPPPSKKSAASATPSRAPKASWCGRTA